MGGSYVWLAAGSEDQLFRAIERQLIQSEPQGSLLR